MTNAEWLIQNKIPFQNINIHIGNIKGIASIYIKDYEKIVYNLELNDPIILNQMTQMMKHKKKW